MVNWSDYDRFACDKKMIQAILTFHDATFYPEHLRTYRDTVLLFIIPEGTVETEAFLVYKTNVKSATLDLLDVRIFRRLTWRENSDKSDYSRL